MCSICAPAARAAESAGFTYPLFDGRSLSEWKVTGCEAVVDQGADAKGVLLLKAGDGFVRSFDRYGDFVLELDWRAKKPTGYDSGIYIRADAPAGNSPWPSRYQINLKDGGEGELLGIEGAKSQGLVKKGDWNHFKITVVGDKAELEINGKPAWKAAGLQLPSGYVGLQSEVDGGGQFEFRSITITDLAFKLVTNGKDLSGWHVSSQTGHSGASGNKSGGRWVVEDGAIVGCQDIPGNGGIVLTDKLYGDFDVAVEMKNDFGPDSGLFLRSNDRGQAYQYMVDYHSGGNLAGIYGEGLSGGIHARNFDFQNLVTEIKPHEASYPLPISPEAWPAFWKHGQWNQLRARIEGNPPKLVTWINGVRFMELSDPEKRHSDTGSVALQVHGGGDFTKQFVRYRNVKVKELGK